jgi:hypothetical protein
MPSFLFFLLAIAFAALGFFGGASLVGVIESLRSRPRYLITLGALALIAGVMIGRALVTQVLWYFPAIFLMMGGIGLISAGWEAETEWQADRAEVHEIRMAQIRRQLAERRPDPLADSPREGTSGPYPSAPGQSNNEL